jgi:hypothetical protein
MGALLVDPPLVGIAYPDVEAMDAGLDISEGESQDLLETPIEYLLLIYLSTCS